MSQRVPNASKKHKTNNYNEKETYRGGFETLHPIRRYSFEVGHKKLGPSDRPNKRKQEISRSKPRRESDQGEPWTSETSSLLGRSGVVE